jgi:hypothetical protein
MRLKGRSFSWFAVGAASVMLALAFLPTAALHSTAAAASIDGSVPSPASESGLLGDTFTYNAPPECNAIGILDDLSMPNYILIKCDGTPDISILPSSFDTLVVNANELANVITLNLPSPLGLITLTINGLGGDDTFMVIGPPSNAVVTLDGGTGSDTFTITPSAAGALSIVGGDPVPPALPGDLLTVDVSGTANPGLNFTSTPIGFQGSFTFADRQPVVFQQIESLPQAAPTHFAVAAPASATAGSSFNFTVTALDQFGNPVTGYSGTVHFTSSDGAALLPADSTLTNGTGTFTATLNTVGNQTLTATDTASPRVTGTSNSIAIGVLVPTMTEWGIILMCALLLGMGVYLPRRRKVVS